MKIKFKKIETDVFNIEKLTESQLRSLTTKYTANIKDSHHVEISECGPHPELIPKIIGEYPEIKNVNNHSEFLSLKNKFEIPNF